MAAPKSSLTSEEALAALRWQEAMGADELLSETGVDRSKEKGEVIAAGPGASAKAAPKDFETRSLVANAKSLDELKEMLAQFESPLKKTATQMVFADGTPGAKLMLIGEAPGREEDEQGKPFVGRAGKLLDKMLAAIGLDRSQVYISNIVNWRPPGNRTPTPQEMAMFLPFIQRHIVLAKPKALVFLGGVSTATLTGSKEGIMKLRGRWLNYTDGETEIPAMPTMHPAYLLRNPIAKRQAWQDLLQIKQKLEAL